MAAHGLYRCDGNDMWCDCMFVMQPNIPVNVRAIEDLVKQSFQNPHDWTKPTIIWRDSPDSDPMKDLGRLKRLSPEEPFFAKVLRIAELIDGGAPDCELERWRVSLSATPFQFEFHDRANAIARHMNLRESSVADGAAVGRTALQRVFEVMQTKRELEEEAKTKISMEKVAAYYAEKVRFAAGSEHVSKAFLESALPVHTYILRCNHNLNLLRWATEQWGSAAPLNSVYKMQVVVIKTEKDPVLISWCIAKVHDACRSGTHSPG
jgi:hypothetical protein